VIWQAGFRNITYAIGTQLTPAQWAQLAEQPGRSVYIVFDQDESRAGRRHLSNSPGASKMLASQPASSSCHTSMIMYRHRERSSSS
jgi:hypothetical protein